MSASIEARSVGFAYGRREVLREVSLELSPGELVVLLGANGAGKSTLLRLLAGFTAPSSGTVTVEGAPIASYGRRELAHRVAYVPQSFGSDHAFRVREMVAMGRWSHVGRLGALGGDDARAVSRALASADLETLSERPFCDLSGGERQRVLFARALAQGASTLLLDEPTASLDLLHAHRVMEHVRREADEGLAILAAVHDVALGARFADRALVLSRGTLVADGPPAEVLTEALFVDAFGVDASLRTEDSGETMLVVRGPASGAQQAED